MVLAPSELPPSDLLYPAKLRAAQQADSVPTLWHIGNPALLSRPLLGFLCSRRCPGDAVLATYDAARELRDAGIAVIGGFHSPMEQEVLDFLLRGEQPVIICRAATLNGFRPPASWQTAVNTGKMLLLSAFGPAIRRTTAKTAHVRNALVVRLSTALFIPYASAGGNVAVVAETARALNMPLFAINGDQLAGQSGLVLRRYELGSVARTLASQRDA